MILTSNLLNNREIALGLWITALLIFGLSHSTIRSSLGNVLRSLFQPKIALPILAGAAYTGLLLLPLKKLGLWNQTLIKDTVFWFVFNGLAAGFSLVSRWKGESLFRKLVLDAIKITTVIEFVTSEYTLSLPWEVALVPVLVMLGGMQSVAETDSKFASVGRLIVFAIAVVSIGLIGYSAHSAYVDWKHFYSVESLRKVALPLVLSMLFAPFIFTLLLLVTYENVLVRLYMGSRSDTMLRQYAKRRIVATFGLRLRKLRHFFDSKSQELMTVRSRSDLDAVLDGENIEGASPPEPSDTT